jgi:deazaflavin-dependent oxidoreductase (nitroreductase family)
VPYLRPPSFTRRVFNPLAMRFGIGGSEVLVVVGRRSGAPRRVPVIPVDHAGGRYLVSPRGDTQWARNLRAAGRALLGPHGRTSPVSALEVPVAERAPVIAAYRARAGRAVASFFEQLPDPADHPVFRVSPIDP